MREGLQSTTGYSWKALCLLSVLVVLSGCGRSRLPSPGTAEYRELNSSFYLGLAALQSGEDVNAAKGLSRAVELAPGEPAGWVNLGLLHARQQDYESAYQNLEKARSIIPDNSKVEELLGMVESRRGNLSAAISHYQKAVALDEKNLRAIYAWAAETERQQTPGSDIDTLNLLDRILKQNPGNEPVLLDVIRLSARLNDNSRFGKAVESLEVKVDSWPEAAIKLFAELRQVGKGPDVRPAAVQAQFLRNTLLRLPAYRKSLYEVRLPATELGEPFLRFVKLPSPQSEPASPDLQTKFQQASQSVNEDLTNDAGKVAWAGSIILNDGGTASLVRIDGDGIRIDESPKISIPGGFGRISGKGVVGADLNYDFLTDLIIASEKGLKIYQQNERQEFTDVTRQTKLPSSVINGSWQGVWVMDFDVDGDLDIFLGVSQGLPVTLRNNGDGTFTPVHLFPETEGLVSFAIADVDHDGVPDVAIVDGSGKLHVFRNDRMGSFTSLPVPAQLREENFAVTSGDVDGDGLIDFVALQSNYSVLRLSGWEASGRWSFQEIIPGQNVSPDFEDTGLLLADLDNNGSLDIIAGNRVFLNDGKSFHLLPERLPVKNLSLIDQNDDGRLDIFGATAEEVPVLLFNEGSKKYKWQVIRTRAATVMGDQRMNPFGIGGEIEVRSGLLTQKQMIQSPVLHFGLGEHDGAEFARIVWPNGLVQTEFDLQSGKPVLAHQRLKGSCPFLFTWDGKKMRFLKDVAPMSAPIGAHRDANVLEDISQTEQWFKISGDELVPRDSYYDVRLTNEYWETHYTDHYSLMVVDHPESTYLFVDERVAQPQAPLRYYLTTQPQSFLKAMDDEGHDVSDLVRTVDQEYLANFGIGKYQGITRDHWVELQLPDHAPASGPLYLIASGFIHPWDDSITIAVGQGKAAPPQDLRIEVPDQNGNWVVVKEHLGIPAGREKTIVLDLDGIFRKGAARKLRLRTNLEIYWDRLAWATGISNGQEQTKKLALSGAELRYRGFSQLEKKEHPAPELALYDVIARTGPQWRNLEGYYTRYGRVRELLERIDDRFVIVNSGDEIRMRFPAPADPPPGWKRDFVFIGDGWIKEGDYNFHHSRTVLPLPFHGMKNYMLPLNVLEDDSVYRRHPEDWQRFHIRYESRDSFMRALWK